MYVIENEYLQLKVFKLFVKSSPNQQQLLNKYQINMGFAHFHEIWDKHICAISNTCCEVIWF